MSHLRPTEPFVWMADPIKGSRFEAWILPASTEAEAMQGLEQARQTHPGATHHCWAFVLADGRSRSSDDGEPGGSAGRPILAQIEGHGIADAMVVVVRWYGGTKLGVGGLIRAYGGTAGKALDRAPLTEVKAMSEVRFRYDYALTQAVDTVLAAEPEIQVERDFQAVVHAVAQVPVDRAEPLRQALTERTGGRIQLD